MSISGKRIRELRTKLNMTLDDVAKHLGVGRQAVYKYEQGTVTNIPLENLEKMASLFRTTPGYLAGWTDSSNPPPMMNLTLFGENTSPQQSPTDDLSSSEERLLITLFRNADDRARKDAIRTLEEHQIRKDDPDAR